MDTSKKPVQNKAEDITIAFSKESLDITEIIDNYAKHKDVGTFEVTNDDLSLKLEMEYFLQTRGMKLYTIPSCVVVHKDLLPLLSVKKINTMVLFIVDDTKGTGTAIPGWPLAETALFSGAMGMPSSMAQMTVTWTSVPWKVVNSFHSRIVIMPDHRDYDGRSHAMNIWYEKENSCWKSSNVAISPKYTGERCKVGNLVLPVCLLKDAINWGVPIWLYIKLRKLDKAAADFVLMKWILSKPIDGDFDEALLPSNRVFPQSMIALVTIRAFLGKCVNVKFGEEQPWLKLCSGSLPFDDDHLYHMMSKDRSCYGSEYLHSTGQDYEGRDMADFACWVFRIVCKQYLNGGKDGNLSHLNLPANSVHIGELVNYILYALYAGDIQAIHQYISHIKKQSGRSAVNWTQKASARDKHVTPHAHPVGGEFTVKILIDTIPTKASEFQIGIDKATAAVRKLYAGNGSQERVGVLDTITYNVTRNGDGNQDNRKKQPYPKQGSGNKAPKPKGDHQRDGPRGEGRPANPYPRGSGKPKQHQGHQPGANNYQ